MNPSYNKIKFTTQASVVDGFYQCTSPLQQFGMCSDNSQNLIGYYKVEGSFIYFAGSSIEIVELTQNKLVIKSAGGFYQEFDKTGIPDVEANQTKLFGTWKLDSVYSVGGLLIIPNTLSTFNFGNTPTSNPMYCGKGFTLSKSGAFTGIANLPGAVVSNINSALLVQLFLSNKWISFENYLCIGENSDVSFKLDFSNNNQNLAITSNNDITYLTKM
jgi:hypothetical protein